jgi:two-component system, chemotaxis family, chemotaxis protein CheY
MANYNFGMYNVLVVEDNRYMRSMMRTLLYALGVGNVVTVGDGGEAIELLRKVKESPEAAGVSSIDIIFSNWQMEPVDGTMLLKWVRRHKESPDRFVPFIIVSGFADYQRVSVCRDLGVTEFLAKPYSVDNLLARLTALVERPRQFVLTENYFGPDRRRKPSPAKVERRLLPESEMEIIYDDR